MGLFLGLSVRSRCRWLVMTISTRSLLLPRPAPGRRGGRRRATGQPRTQRRAAPVRPERQRRTARRAQSSFRKFVVSRLRLAGSGLYGSAAHRAARGPTRNRPAARPAPQICLLRVSARTRRCGDAGTNTLLQTGRTAMALRQGSKPKAETAIAGRPACEAPCGRRPVTTRVAEPSVSDWRHPDTPPIPAGLVGQSSSARRGAPGDREQATGRPQAAESRDRQATAHRTHA